MLHRSLGVLARGNLTSTIMHDPSTNSDVGDFRIEEESPQPAVRVLAVYGDADLHSAPELRERIRGAIDEGAITVVVDLSATTLIDSTSLGVLLGGMKRLREQDGQIRLVVPRPEVRRVFEITLLDRVFPLHDTQEEALAEPSDQAG
jgi:anti-sigma B factor antagonist